MISIITPVLNGEKFILDNLQSIEKLNIDYEHIIVDGGSTDKTLEITRKFNNIKILQQKEKTGMYGGIDFGFREAKGDYICWVNCDDKIIPHGFEEMYKYANKGNFDFVCSDGIINWIYKGKLNKISGTRYAKYFLKKGIFPFLQPSTIFKKDIYLRVKGLDYKRYKICGDMDLFYRMANLENVKFGYISANSSEFIKYGNSLGDKNSDLAKKERKANEVLPSSSKLIRLLYSVVRLIKI